MIYRIIISDIALQDIDSACRYISITLQNKKAASDLLARADATICSLAGFPDRYPLVNDPVLKSFGIRAVKIENYTAFYTVNDQQKTVTIVRFLYFRRNWASILVAAEQDPEE